MSIISKIKAFILELSKPNKTSEELAKEFEATLSPERRKGWQSIAKSIANNPRTVK